MTELRIARFLEALERRLSKEPAFTDDFTGTIELSLSRGGLSGTIKITKLNHPEPENDHGKR